MVAAGFLSCYLLNALSVLLNKNLSFFLLYQEEDEGITLTPPMESSRLTNLAAVSVLTSFMENNRVNNIFR